MFTGLTLGIKGILWSKVITEGDYFGSSKTYSNSFNKALTLEFISFFLGPPSISIEKTWPTKPHITSFKFFCTFDVKLIYKFFLV